MNLKERGITVGDLLLIVIFTMFTILIINKINDKKSQSHYYEIPNLNLSSKII